jgi:hypothetical protein
VKGCASLCLMFDPRNIGALGGRLSQQVQHPVAAVGADAHKTEETTAFGAQADQPRAANHGNPMCQRRCPDNDGIGDPAEAPPRPLSRQTNCLRQDAVPLPPELSPLASRRMKDNGLLGVAEPVAECVRATAPIDVFRDAGAEPADTAEYFFRHEQVSRTRKAILFDVLLEVEGKHGLDGFRRGRLPRLADLRDDLPTDIVEPLESRNSFAEPVPICKTIGVDEGKDRAASRLDTGVACGTGTLLRRWNHDYASSDPLDRMDPSHGVVIGDNHLIAFLRQGLATEGLEAMLKMVEIVIVGYND